MRMFKSILLSLSLAIFALPSLVVSALGSLFDKVLDFVASALPERQSLQFADGAGVYMPFMNDAPPAHTLRHEAGMSRRAADRHT